jgi:hypothetical protein
MDVMAAVARIGRQLLKPMPTAGLAAFGAPVIGAKPNFEKMLKTGIVVREHAEKVLYRERFGHFLSPMKGI